MWQVKATQNKAKPRIHSLLPTGAHHPQGRCSASPGQQGPIMVMVTWAQNHYCSEHPPHSFFPTFYTGHDATWSGIPLGAVGHPLVQLCVPSSPISSATPRGAELASALCQCCSARTPLNYHHVLTNPSHSPMQSLAQDSFTGAGYAGTWLAHTNTAALRKSEFNKHIQPIPGCPWPWCSRSSTPGCDVTSL